MSRFALVPVAIWPVALPLHAEPMHLVRDSVLGVLLGVVAVAVFVVALRWMSRTEGHRDDDN